MLAKPSSNPNPVDPKLTSLADPDLGERLRTEHPELYAQARASELGRVLAIIGLLLGLLASYALGSIMRAHWNDTDAPTLVSLVTPGPLSASAVAVGRDGPGERGGMLSTVPAVTAAYASTC